MRLWGNDIDESTSVVEAGMGWIVGWDKGDFVGRDVLAKQKQDGVARALVGFELLDPGIARHGHRLVDGDGREVGVVTSGTQTPFLKKSIGMAYVPPALAAPGSELLVDIRGRRGRARVVKLPFHSRPKGAAAPQA